MIHSRRSSWLCSGSSGRLTSRSGTGLRRLLKRSIVAGGSSGVGVLDVATVGDSLIVAILE